jgi:hypothetical protein
LGGVPPIRKFGEHGRGDHRRLHARIREPNRRDLFLDGVDSFFVSKIDAAPINMHEAIELSESLV